MIVVVLPLVLSLMIIDLITILAYFIKRRPSGGLHGITGVIAYGAWFLLLFILSITAILIVQIFH